jgi:hypothetical protein
VQENAAKSGHAAVLRWARANGCLQDEPVAAWDAIAPWAGHDSD